jgi:hypothetical protein
MNQNNVLLTKGKVFIYGCRTFEEKITWKLNMDHEGKYVRSKGV